MTRPPEPANTWLPLLVTRLLQVDPRVDDVVMRAPTGIIVPFGVGKTGMARATNARAA